MLSNDFIQECRSLMADAELVPPDELIADGTFHRCGTLRKPHGADGAYKIHDDATPTLFYQNHSTGTQASYTAKAEKRTKSQYLTASQRQEMQEQERVKKLQRQKEQDTSYIAVATKAQDLWSTAKKANQHPYLVKKGVPSYGLKLATDGRLLIAVMNAQGNVQSLQYIAEDGSKRFLANGKKQGGYFPIGAKTRSKKEPLCIAEGYATAASIRMATGYACLVAFDAGNLLTVATMARAKYPDRQIILCADNDINSPKNVGVNKASVAAEAIGGLLAIPESTDKSIDFNDLHLTQGLEAVNAAIAFALAKYEVGVKDPSPQVTSTQEAQTTQEPPHFQQREDGLWHIEVKSDSEPVLTWLCSPLRVLGKTRDSESTSWGLFLEWEDQDLYRHTWAMPNALLVSNDISAWLGRLVDEGLRVAPSKVARRLLTLYLTTHPSKDRILCVDSTGWHNENFILPDAYTKKKDRQGEKQSNEHIVLQPSPVKNPYAVKGTLQDWQDTIGAWSSGNSRLVLAISASLSACLLHHTGTENGGYNFIGGSSTGKTTALYVGASVWGNPTAYTHTWRATDNALEGISCQHNDTCLCLDELGQAPAKVTSEAVYMLANGKGKGRANQDGTTKVAKSWRTIILSTGEKSIAEKIMEDGGRVQAGQDVRLVDIFADAGKGMGIFEHIHGHETPSVFADALKVSAATHCGHLSRAFLHKLVDDDTTTNKINTFITKKLPLFCSANADGQVLRVARRFLLAAATGEKAVEWGLVAWKKGEALQAAITCFKSWIAKRGGTGSHEDNAILEQVMLFIEQHGHSRFQNIETPQAPCLNRVGCRKSIEQGSVYYVFPESFKHEMCKGMNYMHAAKVLLQNNILQQGDKGFTKRPPQALPDFGRKRCYVLVINDGNWESI